MLLLAACQPAAQEGPSPSNTETATVTWIYDGDTIEVARPGGTTDVRLMGINAPDRGECFYEEALDYVIGELEGREVEIAIIGRDQFDRALAYVWVDGMQVNLDLVEQGLAIATTPDSADRYGSLLLSGEEAARSGDVGLWGPTVCGATGVRPELSLEVDPIAEVVTIGNPGPSEIDLSLWTIRDESSRHRFRFPWQAILSEGGTMDIASTESGWDPGEQNVWNNDGDMVMILDDHGRVIAVARYP